MRKFILAILTTTSLAACGRAAPDAGEQAVLISKPWFFGHGGVQDAPVLPGLTFTSWTTSAVYVNMQPQAFAIEYDNIMSSDGIPLNFEATVTLQVTDPVLLVKNYSGALPDWKCGENMCPAWYENNVYPVVNNYVRDAFKAHDMKSLAIETTGTNSVEADVRTRLESYIQQRGVPAKVINFTLGRVSPPEEIKRQRVQTAEEQQRQQTELQTKIAEDNRKAAETSRAAADDAYRNTMGLSPEQFVDLQRIKMEQQVCASGKCAFVVGNAQPIINAK